MGGLKRCLDFAGDASARRPYLKSCDGLTGQSLMVQEPDEPPDGAAEDTKRGKCPDDGEHFSQQLGILLVAQGSLIELKSQQREHHFFGGLVALPGFAHGRL